MELTQLYYFMVVARYEHVTKAAEELHIAQPALTKAIHNLEHELCIKLFENTGRNIKLTNWGIWLKQKISSPLDQILSVKEDISQMKNLSHIKINIQCATIFITKVIIAFKEKYKNVTFSLIQNKKEDADIFVTASKELGDGECFLEEIFLASSKKYSLEKPLEELKDETFITLTDSKPFREICDSYLSPYFTPKIGFECDSVNSIHDLIASGNGIGFWPEYTWGNIYDDIHLMSLKPYGFSRYIKIKKSPYPLNNEKVLDSFYLFLKKCLCEKKIIEP